MISQPHYGFLSQLMSGATLPRCQDLPLVQGLKKKKRCVRGWKGLIVSYCDYIYIKYRLVRIITGNRLAVYWRFS